MHTETLHTLTDAILTLVVSWRERQRQRQQQHQHQGMVPAHDRLNALFQRLQAQPLVDNGYEVEDEIWETWIAGNEPSAGRIMNDAIAAIAQKRYAVAEECLNRLIAAQPDWAEVWNKRATLYFLQGRECESLSDVRRTLELEPRHFGAISGFAQICIRNGDHRSAIIAMDAALQINPHLRALKAALQGMHDERKGAIH
jgi:tetratricopeptide (TPR) repeat protein